MFFKRAGELVLGLGLVVFLYLGVYEAVTYSSEDCFQCKHDSPGYCEFIPAGNEECIFGADFDIVEHTWEPNPNLVLDINDRVLTVGPPPWLMGAYSVHHDSVETLHLQQVMEAHMFNIIGALRNLVMFHPADVANDTLWYSLTRPLVDCSIKSETENLEGTVVRGVDDIREEILLPSQNDMYKEIQRFLEEASSDLNCLATGAYWTQGCEETGFWFCNRCGNIAAKNYIYPEDRSSCFADAYLALFPDEAGSFLPLLNGSYPLGGYLTDEDIDWVVTRPAFYYFDEFAGDMIWYFGNYYTAVGGYGWRICSDILSWLHVLFGWR